jgi:hypothetical protein
MFSLHRNVSRQAAKAQRKPSAARAQPHERANSRKCRARKDHRSPEFAQGFHQPQFYLNRPRKYRASVTALTSWRDRQHSLFPHFAPF